MSEFLTFSAHRVPYRPIPGDFNRLTVAEVKSLLVGDTSGRVQR